MQKPSHKLLKEIVLWLSGFRLDSRAIVVGVHLKGRIRLSGLSSTMIVKSGFMGFCLWVCGLPYDLGLRVQGAPFTPSTPLIQNILPHPALFKIRGTSSVSSYSSLLTFYTFHLAPAVLQPALPVPPGKFRKKNRQSHAI